MIKCKGGGFIMPEVAINLPNDCTRTRTLKKQVANTFLSCLFLTFVFSHAVTAAQLNDVEDIIAPTNATALIYSPEHNSLVLMNSGSAIITIDLGTLNTTTHFSNWNFTDMSISPTGNYVFAADYGGENIGYGTPANQSYVHRLDLSTDTWETKTAYIAGNIQTVSDDQFILKSIDQWVTFTNNSWGTGSAVIPLNTPSGSWGPGYYAGVSEGNFRYEVDTGRLLHGNSGDSSQEIQAFKIINNNFYPQEGSGIYGSAQGYGGTVALATDGSAFYYGELQVDPLDVSHNLRVFPEMIYAATGDIAFGNGNYYDAHTGVLLGSLGFQTTVYGLNANGTDFWAYDSAANLLRHFSTVPGAPSAVTAMGGNAQATVSFTAPAFNGGSPITSYTVTSSPGFIIATGSTSPITVTGLTNWISYTFTVAATNAVGTGPASAPSNNVIPRAPLTPPTATTIAGSSITSTGATLNASVNPNGSSTTVHFQWGTSTYYGHTTTPQSIGSGTSAVGVSAALTGLMPGKTYHFRIVASNIHGTTYGSDVTFTTSSASSGGTPSATTTSATGITFSGATLNATINPNGSSTSVHFQWGTTTFYGYNTISKSIGSGTSAVGVSAALIGLMPGKTYHFRIVASNIHGTTYGSDVTFTTP